MTARDKFLDSVNSAHALSDNELDAVAGGAARNPNQFPTGSAVQITCDSSLRCSRCGSLLNGNTGTVLGYYGYTNSQNLFQVKLSCCVQSGEIFLASQLIAI